MLLFFYFQYSKLFRFSNHKQKDSQKKKLHKLFYPTVKHACVANIVYSNEHSKLFYISPAVSYCILCNAMHIIEKSI